MRSPVLLAAALLVALFVAPHDSPHIALFVVPAAAGEKAPVVLLDFEIGEPADGWSLGSIVLAEIGVPADATPSGGRAIKLVGKGRRGHISRDIEITDWRRFRALSLHVAVTAKSPVRMRIYAASGRGRAAMLRRFALEPGPWREVVLPLADWRQNVAEHVGDFGTVSRIQIQMDEGAGEVSIDDLRLLPGDRGPLSCRPTADDWRRLAFEKKRGRVQESDGFLLLTDAGPMTRKACESLLGLLERGDGVLTERHGLPEVEADPTPVIVFGDERSFRPFFPRLGAHLGAEIPVQRSDAATFLGVAAGQFRAKYGYARPLLFRRAMSARLERRLGVASTGNWIQRGLSWAVQLHIFPETGVEAGLLAKRFETLAGGGDGPFLPLGELLALEKPTSKNDLQLATVMDWLAERHRERLPEYWKRIRTTGKPLRVVGPEALAAALGKDLTELHADYVAWGVER